MSFAATHWPHAAQVNRVARILASCACVVAHAHAHAQDSPADPARSLPTTPPTLETQQVTGSAQAQRTGLRQDFALAARGHTKGITDWSALDKRNAREWIQSWIGKRAWDVMWQRAFHLKFFEYTDQLSASWIGTRIKRIALSRRLGEAAPAPRGDAGRVGQVLDEHAAARPA